MISMYDDLNPDWGEETPDLPGWEPWEPDEEDIADPQACAYCGNPDVRDRPEPFGGKPCCDPCFNILIGGDENDPAWRCGNDRTEAS